MAKLPASKRLHREDIPDSPDWMNKVMFVMNTFFQAVYSALDGGLTFQDNFAGKVLNLRVVGGQFPQQISAPIDIVSGILIMQIDNGTTLTGAAQVVWQQIGQTIEITEVTGLAAGVEYNARILVV